MTFLVRVILLALAFHFILPRIPGIEVTQGLWTSVGLALMFSILGSIVSWVAALLTAVLAVSTLGLGLIVLIPLWLLGFWLLPAYVLFLTASILPSYLTIAGWGPAIMGGLITLVIGMVSEPIGKKASAS